MSCQLDIDHSQVFILILCLILLLSLSLSLFLLCFCRCLNADPNYGTAWFFLRDRPIDTPGAIIDAARTVLTHELLTLSEAMYTRAMVHFVVTTIQTRKLTPHTQTSAPMASGSARDFDFSAWLMDWTSVHPAWEAQCSAPLESVDGLVILASQDFITGTVQLSRTMCTTGREAPLDERREMLYGSDQITP
mgnify:FL=1